MNFIDTSVTGSPRESVVPKYCSVHPSFEKTHFYFEVTNTKESGIGKTVNFLDSDEPPNQKNFQIHLHESPIQSISIKSVLRYIQNPSFPSENIFLFKGDFHNCKIK